MSINLIVGAGDGYTKDTQSEFIHYLSQHGFNCVQIPPIEANPNASYDDLRPENYCQHIDSYINPKLDYWMFGISKSCH